MKANTRVKQIYDSLEERGLAAKYGRAGVYSISIENTLVYIGKSIHMLERVAEHLAEIEKKNPTSNKYKVLKEAVARGYTINFDVLFVASCNAKGVKRSIGYKEGALIREHLPPLNYQIPDSRGYKHYTTNPRAKTITLDEIIPPVT